LTKYEQHTTKNLAVAAIVAAILVVGGTFAATVTQSAAAAYDHKKGGGIKENSKNGNTVTLQKDKQDGTQSGFDTSFEEEGQNLICTHPDNNATCSQEGAVAPVKRTCEQCFTIILKPEQITTVLGSSVSVALACATFNQETEADFKNGLIVLGIPMQTANDLIACLLKAGIVFKPA
jgi:hypothetical protein